MNSVTQTAGVSISAVTLAPYFQWALGGFHGPAPEGLALLLAAVSITAGHALYRIIKAKYFPSQEQAHA